MGKLRILKNILVKTGASRFLATYCIFFFLIALFIFITEPNIETYWDALWYCYSVVSTAGFGDILATSILARIASVVLTVYSVVIIAIITSVIVNFYTQIIQIRQKESIAAMADQLERLPELSKQELAELSKKISRFRSNASGE